MPNSYVIAGQAAPLAATDTLLYTVPAGKSFVMSALTAVNRDKASDAAEIRLAIVPSGQSLGNQHYLVYDRFLDQREEFTKQGVATLPAGTQVYVRASTANCSFSLFGAEITPAS